MVNGNNENKWRDMNAAEWRGKIGEKIDRLETLVAGSCAKVDSHDTELAILRDRATQAQLGWKPRAIIAASLIGAITSIIITLTS